MSLDFSPAAAPAPAPRRLLRQGLIETSLLLRNGEQLLLALVIPVVALLAGRLVAARIGLDAALVPPGVFALAVWSTAFTSTAISTGFDRRHGVLERLATTPLGRTGLLVGKVLAVCTVIFGQLVVLGGVAAAVGWRPTGAVVPWLGACVALVLAVAAFTGLALALAGRASAELTLALANLIFLVGAGAGGLLLPLADHPAWARPVLAGLPTAALGEVFRGLATGHLAGWPLLVLAVWAAGAAVLARKVFRWLS